MYLGSMTKAIDNFDYTGDTEVLYSCSLTWRNIMLVLGGSEVDDQQETTFLNVLLLKKDTKFDKQK